MDLDPSGNLTETLGIDVDLDDPDAHTVYHLLRRGRRLALRQLVRRVEFERFGLDVIPANHELRSVVFSIRDNPNWGQTLARELWRDLPYDVVVIDCPPRHGEFTYLALGAATDVLVELQPESEALSGTTEMVRHIEAMRGLNPVLSHHWMVVNMADLRTGLARQMNALLRRNFPNHLCKTIIPRAIRIAEANVARRPVIEYYPDGSAATALRELADVLLSPGGAW